MGGPGGISAHSGVSGDQPALVFTDTLNRYHTPGSGDRYGLVREGNSKGCIQERKKNE